MNVSINLRGLVVAGKREKGKFQILLLPLLPSLTTYLLCTKLFELTYYIKISQTCIMFYHIFWPEIYQASKTWMAVHGLSVVRRFGVSRNSDLLDLDRVMMAPRLVDIVVWSKCSDCSALFSTRFGDPETDLNTTPSCCFSMILRFRNMLWLRLFQTRQGNVGLCLCPFCSSCTISMVCRPLRYSPNSVATLKGFLR